MTTRRDTFTNLKDVWMKEIELYTTDQECIKMLVGNKVDKESDRVVTKKEGIGFAREYGCLFIECSAKNRINVEQCFEELVLKILDTPSLCAEQVSKRTTSLSKNHHQTMLLLAAVVDLVALSKVPRQTLQSDRIS